MRILALLGLLLVAFAPHGAEARAQHAPASFFCPFGAALPDGCGQSQPFQPGSTATFQPTGRNPGDFINQLTATSTNYATNGPPWNLCAIDYPCGEYTPVGQLLDPANGVPAGCAYNATGNISGGPLVTCTQPTLTSLVGYSFDSNSNHGCVSLEITGTATVGVPALISDNLFKNEGSCAVSSIQPEQVLAEGSNTDLIFSYNTFDGNGLVFEQFWGTCTPGGPLACSAGQQAFQVGGEALFQYNDFLNYTARSYQYNSTNPNYGFAMNNNFMLGCCTNDLLAHGEFVEYASTAPFPIPGATGMSWSFNTIIDPTSHDGTGEALIPQQFSNAGVPIFAQENNFYVPGFDGGQTSAVVESGHLTGSTFVVDTLGSFTFTGAIAPGSGGTGTLTLTGAPVSPLKAGMLLLSGSGTGSFVATTITGLLTGIGGNGSTYSVANSQTFTGTITAQETLGQQQQIDCGPLESTSVIVTSISGGTMVVTAPTTNIIVTSISGGKMTATSTTGGSVTIPNGALILSAASGFPTSVAVTSGGGGTGTSFSVTASGTFSGSAAATSGGPVALTTGAFVVSSVSGFPVTVNVTTGGTGTSFPVTASGSGAYSGGPITVASISGTTMTLSSPATISAGSSIVSAASGFPTGITVSTGGTGSTFTITNPNSGTVSTSTAATAEAAATVLLGNNISLGNVSTGSTGTTSAGIGGGAWGGVGSTWPMDTAGNASITGFIDDGNGSGAPDGVSGNVLTVVVDDSMNLLGPGITVAAAVSGVTRNLTVAAKGGATGGVGQYTLSGTGSTGTSTYEIISVAPANGYRGGWSIPPGTTLACAAQEFFPAPFTRAFADETNANPIGQAIHTNNYMDMSVYGPNATIWNQRTGGSNSFTGSIDTSGNLTISGLTGSALSGHPTLVGTPSGTSEFVSITNAAYSSGSTGTMGSQTGFVTFTVNGIPPGLVLGGTFTVSGVVTNPASPNLFNTTYTVVVSPSGSTIIGALSSGGNLGPAGSFTAATSLTQGLVGTGVPGGTFLASGSGTSWVVSPAPSVAIGPEAMHTVTTWCQNPTIFSGNIDMTGLNSSANTDAYTGTVPGNGC
jgi:hypothetical protein